jgi:hypothetical protein
LAKKVVFCRWTLALYLPDRLVDFGGLSLLMAEWEDLFPCRGRIGSLIAYPVLCVSRFARFHPLDSLFA